MVELPSVWLGSAYSQPAASVWLGSAYSRPPASYGIKNTSPVIVAPSTAAARPSSGGQCSR
jgi:hypothetical protein